MSKGEEYIFDILTREKINFIQEATFKDLKTGKFRFDFFLKELNILIEVDGVQHYKSSSFGRGYSEFTKQWARDREKNSYALSHKIKLYRIPYWELKNLNSFNDIISNDNFLVKNRWHNDEIRRQFFK